MNETEPVVSERPEPSGDSPDTRWKLVLNGLSLLMAVLTLAPIGIFADIGSRNFIPERGTNFALAAFWPLFLFLAAWAMNARNRNLGRILTFIVLALALLNVHGCVAAVHGFGKATGG